jgi:hypothetical protein
MPNGFGFVKHVTNHILGKSEVIEITNAGIALLS